MSNCKFARLTDGSGDWIACTFVALALGNFLMTWRRVQLGSGLKTGRIRQCRTYSVVDSWLRDQLGVLS